MNKNILYTVGTSAHSMKPNLSGCPHVASVGTRTDPAGNFHLHRKGPQSARPLPRWYWYDIKQTKPRWRQFDRTEALLINNILESKSEAGKSKGLSVGHLSNTPLYITSWNHLERKGSFRWKSGDGTVFTIERKSQQESIDIQVTHFVYDHSGPLSHALRGYPHMIAAFKEMMQHELNDSKTHVFFYHSYGGSAIMNDVGACLRRILMFGQVPDALKTAILPRTDQSTFNNRGVSNIKENFRTWFGVDTVDTFRALGLSTVMNCLNPNAPEAPVVEYFKGYYAVGTNLNGPLDELLALFDIGDLKTKLLELTLEYDIDVRPYFDQSCCFVRKDKQWQPLPFVESGEVIAALSAQYFVDEDGNETSWYEDDNHVRSVEIVTHHSQWKIEVFRLTPGGQIQGIATQAGQAQPYEIRVLTPNTGHYLQLAVPHHLVDEIAYENSWVTGYWGDPRQELGPMGFSMGPPMGPLFPPLSNVQHLATSVNGQARIIANPSRLWMDGIQQHIYQFSRYAASKRNEYLERMDKLLRDKIITTELRERGTRVFDPPPITVWTHNIWYKNTSRSQIALGASYDFMCIQEATGTILNTRFTSLPATHTILRKRVCNSDKVYGAIIYRSERFELINSYFGCFKLRNGTLDSGRPIVAVAFNDKWLRRRVMVMSVHAPHKNKTPYSLGPNLNFVYSQVGVPCENIIIGGDFNRRDWGKQRTIDTYPLSSAQGDRNKSHLTHTTGDIDNILYGSTQFKYTLELRGVKMGANYGSDHSPLGARFFA